MSAVNLDFGLLLHTRHLINENGPSKFDQLWADAAAAEKMGFDHIWLGDSVTILDKARSDCLTTMAALAAKTRSIRIGVVPFLAVLRNPVLLAHALATLDVISEGRIIVAASVGSLKNDMNHQFNACGVPHHEKAGRLNESIEIMRRLWTERTVTFEGKYYQIREVGILPHPVQQPTIPIWLATGKNEKALKRASKLGDGWVGNASNVNDFAQCLRTVNSFSEKRQNADKRVAALYATFNLNADGERAAREGWAWMEEFFKQPRTRLGQHLAIFGTPAECAKTLRGYIQAGLTTIIARFASHDQYTQARLFLDELKPRLALDAGAS